ncbi:MAG: hypothetical protein WC713_06755 [Candidatus Methylomirabilota bacterium]
MTPSEKILETLYSLEYYCYADDDDGGDKYVNDINIIRKGFEEREKDLAVYDLALDILGQNACIGKPSAIDQARKELEK